MVKRTEEALGFKSQLHSCLRVLSSSMGLVVMAPASWGHSDRYSDRTFPRPLLTAMEELLVLSQRCGPSETADPSRWPTGVCFPELCFWGLSSALRPQPS